MFSQVVLVTGGNTGLGLEIVRILYQSSKAYNILLRSQSLDKARVAIEDLISEPLDTVTTIEPIQIEIEDDASILSAYELVEEGIWAFRCPGEQRRYDILSNWIHHMMPLYLFEYTQ